MTVPQDYRDRILTELQDLATHHAARGSRSRTARRPTVAIAVSAAAAGAVAFAPLVAPSQGDRIVARAAAALTPTDGGVLHTLLVGHNIRSDRIESWQATVDGEDLIRIVANGTRPDGTSCPMEASHRRSADRRTDHAQTWRPDLRRVHAATVAMKPGWRMTPDPFPAIRRHLADGDLVQTARTTINGRPAIELAPRHPDALPDDGGDMGDLQRSFRYYVDADTAMPLRWVISRAGIAGRRIDQWYDVPVFTDLPDTPENLALTSVAGAHPAAPVVSGDLPAPAPRHACGVG